MHRIIFLFIFIGWNCSIQASDNRALKGEITTSSQLSSHPISDAFDGDYDTYWEAGETAFSQWIEIELDTICYLVKVQQIFNQSSVWKFIIEGSRDRQHWMTLVDHGKGAAGISFVESIHGYYKYIRFTVLDSSDNYPASSREFSVTSLSGGTNILQYQGIVEGTGAQFCEPAKACDNAISTYWCAINGTYPHILKVDLEESFYITNIQQVFKDYDQWKFRVEASNDKNHWTVVANKSSGENGCEFNIGVNDNYRYFRLVILGSATGYWANSCEFRIFGYKNNGENEEPMPVSTRWWQNESGLSRYYTKIYNYVLSDITADLDNLKSQGYNMLELMCPYEGKADIWGGLGATDNYAIDPSIGTMEDFEELIRQAHERNMKIIFFGNIGYCRDEAPFFQKACEDERKDVYSKERRWFHFSDTQPNDRWFWSETAQAYYYSYWGNTDGAAGRIPSYNFRNQEWRDETKKYLRFWANKGIDGFFLDAPEAYDGITDEIIEDCIVNTLNEYDLLTNAEGSGDINRWFGRFKYNCIQGFDMYGWGGGGRSEVLNALRNHNPSGLNDRLKGYRDKAVHMNGVTLTPPMWEMRATENERIFETAYLISMGTLFANHCGDYHYVAQDIIPTWNPASQDRFYELLRTQSSYKGLAPSGQRTKLPSNDDTKYSAFKRTNTDGNVSALVIFNFQPLRQSITVNLLNSGIKIPQTPVNVLTGTASDPIQTENYTVSLPACGFLILGVENDFGQKTAITPIEKPESNLRLQIFPNPFVDDLTVQCPHHLKTIKVYSVSGVLVREYNTHNTGYFKINNIGLSSGVYILKATDMNNKEYTAKIVCI